LTGVGLAAKKIAITNDDEAKSYQVVAQKYFDFMHAQRAEAKLQAQLSLDTTFLNASIGHKQELEQFDPAASSIAVSATKKRIKFLEGQIQAQEKMNAKTADKISAANEALHQIQSGLKESLSEYLKEYHPAEDAHNEKEFTFTFLEDRVQVK
jgi:hypothetical protein